MDLLKNPDKRAKNFRRESAVSEWCYLMVDMTTKSWAELAFASSSNTRVFGELEVDCLAIDRDPLSQ